MKVVLPPLAVHNLRSEDLSGCVIHEPRKGYFLAKGD